MVANESRFPKHFDGKQFYNPDGRRGPRFRDALRWKLTSCPAASPRFISDVVASVPPRRVEGSALRITLVNHSTVLIQQAGLNILTDPIWSERASPLSSVGPRRRRKPGISWDDLPSIDAVLITHNHYDHLDLPTLRRLAAFREPMFIVPARVERLLGSNKIGPVHELDWGESFAFPSSTIHCTPAVHFSNRGIFDRNISLWCGYMIESPQRLIYFAGDTGFGPHFAQIREEFGSPNLALLPIGAYEPRWLISRVHMAPDEAVRAHEILGATISIAIHHGTFQLTDEGIDTPKEQLVACRGHEPFLVLNNGQFAKIP